MGDRFYDGAVPLDISVLDGVNSDGEPRIRLRFTGHGAERVVYLTDEQAELVADLITRKIVIPEGVPVSVITPERQQIDMNAVTTPDDPQVDWTPDQLRHLQAYGIDEALLQGHLANVHGVPPSDMPRGLEARRRLHEELTA